MWTIFLSSHPAYNTFLMEIMATVYSYVTFWIQAYTADLGGIEGWDVVLCWEWFRLGLGRDWWEELTVGCYGDWGRYRVITVISIISGPLWCILIRFRFTTKHTRQQNEEKPTNPNRNINIDHYINFFFHQNLKPKLILLPHTHNNHNISITPLRCIFTMLNNIP